VRPARRVLACNSEAVNVCCFDYAIASRYMFADMGGPREIILHALPGKVLGCL
jgi:hypothetical protein